MRRSKKTTGEKPASKARRARPPARSAHATYPPEPAAPGNVSAIVGLGSSAGGLGALTKLFGALPSDSGMAFVIVAHLDPTHESFMAELLGRCTAMPVL